MSANCSKFAVSTFPLPCQWLVICFTRPTWHYLLYGNALVCWLLIYYAGKLYFDCLPQVADTRFWKWHHPCFIYFWRYSLLLGHFGRNCYWQQFCFCTGPWHSCQLISDSAHMYFPLQLPGEWCGWTASFWCLEGHYQKYPKRGSLASISLLTGFPGQSQLLPRARKCW